MFIGLYSVTITAKCRFHGSFLITSLTWFVCVTKGLKSNHNCRVIKLWAIFLVFAIHTRKLLNYLSLWNSGYFKSFSLSHVAVQQVALYSSQRLLFVNINLIKFFCFVVSKTFSLLNYFQADKINVDISESFMKQMILPFLFGTMWFCPTSKLILIK